MVWCEKLKVVLAVAILLLSEFTHGAIHIIDKSPTDGTIVKKGKSVRLSCRTDIRWFFCLWKSPANDKSCAIQQDANPQSVCQADNRMQLDSGLTNCDIVIREVRPEDYGQWMCMVTDANNFDTAKQYVSLEVGQPALVKFEPGFGNQNELRLTEGDTKKIRCAALSGHPTAQISWEEPKEAQLDTKETPQIRRDNTAHTTDVYHTVEYKADLRDNDKEIVCLATQFDKDGRTILYEGSTSLKLKIDKIVVPVDNALTQKIGIISGVILAFILLILLLVFCICVVCRRRRRKRSRPPSSQATSTEDGGSPDQTLKPIWTTRAGNGNNPQIATYTDLLEPEIKQMASAPSRIRHTNSQGTMSTRSTTSQNSWEEDRSVGGEVEEVPVEKRIGKVSPPSLHETHFGSDFDLPRTVLHHPDPYLQQVPPHQQHPQHSHFPIYAQPSRPLGRPSSSADHSSPYFPLSSSNQQYPYSPYPPGSATPGRPTSAMSFPAGATPEGLMPTYRRLPTPNGQLTTSVKSVFDCDLGCFVDLEAKESDVAEGGANGRKCNHPPSDSTQSTPSKTSDPKDV